MRILSQAERSHNQHERQADAPTLAWGLSVLMALFDISLGSDGCSMAVMRRHAEAMAGVEFTRGRGSKPGPVAN